MPSTTAILLLRSLDYAGLFPPASLPVSVALQQFTAERSANSAEMLSRFVCPVLRLEELAAAAAQASAPLCLSVLPRGGKSAGEFLANLETDLATIQRVAQLNRGLIAIDVVEVRPPADTLQQPALRKLLAAVNALLSRRAVEIRQVFVELAPGPQLANQLELLAELSVYAAGGDVPPLLGYKLRTGGSDAAAVPASSQVATALGAAAALHIPMKCTGGLHRPLRSQGANPMHGFINLLVAAAFATTTSIEAGLVEAVLEESDPAAFIFDAHGVTWREHKLTAKAIATAREELLISFGSCYADQPRLELQKLGWWPKSSRARVAGTAV